NIFLPLAFEDFHVDVAESLSQSLVAGRVCFLAGVEGAVLCQQAFLLEVVTEITRLGVGGALVIIIKTARVERGETTKRLHGAGLNRSLQSGQTPVVESVNAAVDLAALFRASPDLH